MRTQRATTHEECERCEGSGADPMQPFTAGEETDVRVCVECFGEGWVEVFEFRLPERLSA